MIKIRFIHQGRVIELPQQVLREVVDYEQDGQTVHDVTVRDMFGHGYTLFLAAQSFETVDEVPYDGSNPGVQGPNQVAQ